LRAAIAGSLKNGAADDVLNLFVQAIEAEAGITLNQAAINAVHATFP
jgi:hypothetical protein